MAFDMGFNARGTVEFTTDQDYACFVAAVHSYPHTYTNGNGDSVNAGWNGAVIAENDTGHPGNDPRICGSNYHNTGTPTFQVDLSSGSAPGAGTYTVDLAMGEGYYSDRQEFALKDNTTTLIDGTAGYTPAIGQHIDATLTAVTATTTWTGTTVSKTFASTTANLVLSPTGGHYTALAHFRLTFQAGGAAATTLKSSLMLQGVGA